MSHDSSSLDLLPDDDSSGEPSGRRTQVLVVLVTVLVVVGAVAVLILVASQRGSGPDAPAPGATTTASAGPSDDPTDQVSDDDLDTALADLDLARSTLASAVESADGLLVGSDGKVADDAVRVALSDALVVARSALDADVDRTRAGDVRSVLTRTRATTATLQHAAGIVADSHEEWLLQQQPPPTGVPAAPTPDPPVSPVDPLPVPTDLGDVPGPVTPPDRTPRPGPAPVPIPDDQS